jgi:ABC-type transporter Mla MlaB component
MATKGIGSGLLSKVAKFVRHPTKDWSELDQIGVESAPDTEQEKGYSKEALKEMIERKRRNDFVRGREFDQLRKMRANIPINNPDRNDRPSFFLASTNASHLEERASTIKKIDDIEAQMSKQWWKGKPGDQPPKSNETPSAQDPQQQTTLPMNAPGGEFSQTLPPQSFVGSELGDARAFAATQPIDRWDGRAPVADTEPQEMMKFGNMAGSPAVTGDKEFSLSGLFSIDLGDSLVDPDMEEAAIRFANGEDAQAEAGLLAVLRSGKVRAESAEGWAAALFDLYRATGQEDSFAHFGMECAQRFGQPAPAWFSTPALLRRQAPAADIIWRSPAELDLTALQDLQAVLSARPAPWHLDWRTLRTIAPLAGSSLADLFGQWCVQSVSLIFSGAEQLEKVLKSCTPAGDRQVEMFWWRLRLDALRVMSLQDEFELAALDFCVIHEIAPPPWQQVRCAYAVAATDPLGTPAGDSNAAPQLSLEGEIRGDATEMLNRLQTALPASALIDISCDRLIRVDFSAAGSILNWVVARETQGTQIRFHDVPCLVAAFFNIIGINEHARVLLRNS